MQDYITRIHRMLYRIATKIFILRLNIAKISRCQRNNQRNNKKKNFKMKKIDLLQKDNNQIDINLINCIAGVKKQ